MTRIAIVAPHASPIPMDGGSIRSRAIADAFAGAGFEVVFFGREQQLRITKEDGISVKPGVERGGGKLLPACMSLVKRTHYVKEKHMPEEWVAATCDALNQLRIETVLLNFVWSEEVGRRLRYSPRVLLDTHNNEVEWFENLIKQGKAGVIGRAICRSSIRYSLRAIGTINPATELIHVSSRDLEFYKSKRPDLVHRLLPNGCFVRPRKATPDYGCPTKQLFFLGSLSTSMNQDALEMFAGRFWHILKNNCAFTVIGSNPPESIHALCRSNGWSLSPNPTEVELNRLLEKMHYAALPFLYGAGSKLKLLDACARGIPVLATGGGVTGVTKLPDGVFVSEVPEQWREWLQSNTFLRERDGLIDFARSYSWENLIGNFIRDAAL